MNFRKVTSTIAALALSIGSFAGLTLTASAAESVYNDAFTSGSASYTWSGNADKAVQSDGAESNAKGGSSYRIQGASNGRQRPAWSDVSSNALTGVIRVNLNLRMDSSYNSTSSTQTFKLLSATPTDANNDTTGKSILEFASTTADSGYSSSYKFNGTAIESLDQGNAYSNAARNSSGWLNFDVLLNTNTQKFDITIKRITNNNSGDTYTLGETVYSATNVSFMNDVSAFKSIFVFTARYPSYNGGQTWLDDISVKQLSMPSLTLDKDATSIATGGNDTIGGTVTLGTAGDSVLTTASSDNNDVSVTVTNETTTSPTITVTSTGNTSTSATIKVTTKTTGANADVGETVSKDIAVVVGALSYADVTVEYKDSNGNTLKSPTTVEDQIVNMPYTVTSDLTGNFDYTNPTTGVQYTASLNSNSPTSVASVAAEGSTLTLIFDLTEWKYSATVNTNPNTTVTISGTSTSGETVSETIVSSYTGVATFSSSLYVGTYTVTATKSGYTTDNSQTITINTSGTATATVPALVPSTSGVVFYEDFNNGNNKNFTSGANDWNGGRLRVTNQEGTTDTLDISDTSYDKYTITLTNITATSNYSGTGSAASSIEIRHAGTTFAGIKASKGGSSSGNPYTFSGFISGNVQEDIKVNGSYDTLTGDLVVEIDKATGNFTATFTGNNFDDYSYTGTVENFDIENLTIYMGRGTNTYPYLKKVTITGENYPAVATVTVTDGNNNSAPLSGATVTVGSYTATETSTPGTYTVSVPYDTTTGSSTYEVSVSKDGYPSNTGSITVTSSGGSTTVELTKVGYIINTKPYAAISIDGAAAVSTGRSGTYTFALGATGSHSVEISKDGYQTVTETVTPADNGHIDLPLSPNAGIVYQEDFTYVEDNFGFTNATVSNGEFTNGDGKNSGETVTLPETVDISGTVVTMRAKVSRLDRAVYLNFGPVSIYFNSAGQTNYSQNNTSSTTDYRLVQVYMPTSNDTTHRPIFYVDGVRYHTTDNARVANDAKSVTTFGYSNLGNALTAQIDYIKVEKLTSGDTEPTSTVTVNGTSTNYLVGTTAAFELGYNAIGTPTVVNTSDDSATGITPKASGNGYTFTVPANNVTVKCLGYSTPVEIDSYTTSAAAGYTKGDTITDGDGKYARGFTFMTYAGGLTYTNVSVTAAGAQNSKFDKVNGSADYTTGPTATASATSNTVISGDAIFGIVIWTGNENKIDTIKNFDPSNFTIEIN